MDEFGGGFLRSLMMGFFLALLLSFVFVWFPDLFRPLIAARLWAISIDALISSSPRRIAAPCLSPISAHHAAHRRF